MSNLSLIAFLTTVSVIGTVGNLIVAFVYWKKKDKQTSSFFILVLSCSDWIVCSVLVPMTIYIESIVYSTQNIYFCKSYYFLTTTIVPSSCLLMIAIAFDRYFCICMVSKSVMNLQRAKILVIVLILVSCLMGVIPSLAAVIQQETSSSLNFNNSNETSYPSETETTYVCTLITDVASNSSEFLTFINLASLVHYFKYCYDLIYLITVIVITILYVLIYKEIYTRRKVKRKRKRQLLFSSWLNGGGKKKSTERVDMKKSTPNVKFNDNNVVIVRILECKEEEVKDDEALKNNLIMKSHFESPTDEQKKANQEDLGKILNENIIEASKSNNKKILNSSPLLNETQTALTFKKSINVISAKDVRTAFMLFVITFLFIAFFSPSLISTYITLLKPKSSDGEPNLILTYLYFSNSAINPIIYCFLNPNFRADLLKLFFKRGSAYNTCAKNFCNFK